MIKLPTSLYKKLVGHAQDEFPQECCGLVAGVSQEEIEVKEVYPMTNTDASAEHFSMDPKEQFKVVKEIRSEDYEMIGNYHSHPFTPSRPSEEDKRLAYDQEAIYFILSLAGEEPVLKAFRIKEQQDVIEVEIELI
ncbi:putative metal-dependent protease of the PAD1/JAB1 superfamily [Halobacteroides halobius DSM 5150]|uniref:Putative metal-dependent protease of the PAD1/JAB1 superfamily n=1 Tax=Halobacteroides halobius (strain ATCC 35273 / DSM 5150 / MD-1) TaxID=748449 RepID=L0KB24_HALHC|nr:M67 family metallopeptidase [Halobacteroides halobius]AGB42216.1 putative metal-dependent protease of the PAD1/JAB1 superfamily [Halobacteroides halobius DSM 5150]